MNKRLLDAESVIFDIGNVLLTFDPDEIARRLLPEKHRAILASAIFRQGYWQQMDAGLLDSAKAAELMCASCSRPDLYAEALHLIDNYPRELEPMPAISLIAPLKALGKRVYALSNFPEAGFNLTSSLHGFLSMMDGLVISSRLKISKPDPGIYRALLDTYRINPARAVFIDDFPVNIAAAENAGISGILYTGFEVLQ
jgi:putative hydrolase of the HAD superfamily